MDDDAIETHFVQEAGQLSVRCGKRAFARLRALVCEAARVGPADVEAIRGLHIHEAPAREGTRSRVRLGDCLTLWTCALLSLLLLAVVVAGVITLWGWFTRL